MPHPGPDPAIASAVYWCTDQGLMAPSEPRFDAGAGVGPSFAISQTARPPHTPLVWAETVRAAVPCQFVHPVGFEALQPTPAAIRQWRMSPVRASARLTSDRQGADIVFSWTVEVTFQDEDGDVHRVEKPYTLRRQTWLDGVQPGMDVRVIAGGNPLGGQVRRNGRRTAFRGEVAVTGIVCVTEPGLYSIPLGDPLPAPVALPIVPLTGAPEGTGESSEPTAHHLEPEAAEPAHRSAIPFAAALAPPLLFFGDGEIRGLIRLQPGWRPISVHTRPCHGPVAIRSATEFIADPGLQYGGETALEVRLVLQHDDGDRREGTWLVRIPSAVGAVEVVDEGLQPVNDRVSAWSPTVVHRLRVQRTRSTPPVPLPAAASDPARRRPAPPANPRTLVDTAQSRGCEPSPAAKQDSDPEEHRERTLAEPLVWRLPQPEFPRRQLSAAKGTRQPGANRGSR